MESAELLSLPVRADRCHLWFPSDDQEKDFWNDRSQDWSFNAGWLVFSFMATRCLIPVTFFVLVFLTGCPERREDIVSVSGEDAEMNAAMVKARSTLDQFWAKRSRDGDQFGGLLKVYFSDPGAEEEGEHMWVQVTSRTDDRISGVLLSDPRSLKSVKEGDAVEFRSERVSDWLYVEDGKAVGAFTVKLLRSRMSDAERQSHDSGYPFRFE